jgi:hypothetical protein
MWSATWMQMMQWWETRWKGRTCCWCNCWYLLIYYNDVGKWRFLSPFVTVSLEVLFFFFLMLSRFSFFLSRDSHKVIMQASVPVKRASNGEEPYNYWKIWRKRTRHFLNIWGYLGLVT